MSVYDDGGKGIKKTPSKDLYLTLAARKGHAKAEQLLKKFGAEIQWKIKKKPKNGKWLATASSWFFFSILIFSAGGFDHWYPYVIAIT